jgi:hypothetical protein
LQARDTVAWLREKLKELDNLKISEVLHHQA